MLIPERGLAGGSSTDGQLKSTADPQIHRRSSLPKVVRAGSSREIDQFTRFIKRAGGDLDSHLRSNASASGFADADHLADRGEGMGPTCAGTPPESLGSCSRQAAGIVPATQRVDLNGQADPLAKDKVKLAKQLKAGVQSYLERLRKDWRRSSGA